MLKHTPLYYAEKYKHCYMRMAEVASQNSLAVRNQAGCIIYLNDHTLSPGWNGMFSGSDTEVCEYSLGGVLFSKHHVVHAEHNAILKVVSPELLKGAILFTSLQPCLGCSKLIADAGITHVYYKYKYRCDKGLKYLERNGIVVEQID